MSSTYKIKCIQNHTLLRQKLGMYIKLDKFVFTNGNSNKHIGMSILKMIFQGIDFVLPK